VASPDKKAFLLRLPHEVWAQIERLAGAELRSVNGQIEYLLREALARRTGTGDPKTPRGEESLDGAASGRRSGQKNKR
jgi:hypothetical protein